MQLFTFAIEFFNILYKINETQQIIEYKLAVSFSGFTVQNLLKMQLGQNYFREKQFLQTPVELTSHQHS